MSRIHIVGAALAATLAVGVITSNASAASLTPGDFSAWVPPSRGYVDNCTVDLGPVVDTVPAPNYRKIGGVRVNCGSVHSVIKATGWEEYWNGNSWTDWGYSTVGTRYNQAGSGFGISGILRSPAYCGPNRNIHYYWVTAALVQTENVGKYLYSLPTLDTSGC
jgi:hypothetical protein